MKVSWWCLEVGKSKEIDLTTGFPQNSMAQQDLCWTHSPQRVKLDPGRVSELTVLVMDNRGQIQNNWSTRKPSGSTANAEPRAGWIAPSASPVAKHTGTLAPFLRSPQRGSILVQGFTSEQQVQDRSYCLSLQEQGLFKYLLWRET